MAARHLGLEDDIPAYDEDIEILSEALQKHSWDEDSGYFAYVIHDDDGYPKNILKYKDQVVCTKI
jgi:hypothetical protein